MKNLFKLIGIITLVALIVFSFAACGDSGGGDGGGNSVNGTWKAGDDTITLDNGNFQIAEDNKQTFKGTYTTSGNNIAMVVTHIFGAALKEGLSEGGMDVTIDESKWYNKDQVIDIITNYMKTAGATDAQISATLAEISGDLDNMFPTITGTVNGGNLILGDTTFTKGSGSTGPGTDPGTDPGNGGGSVVTGNWTVVADCKIDKTINAIAYGNGTFIAGGDDGKMAYSTDNCVTWTAVADSKFSSEENCDIKAIVYGNGTFVAAGSRYNDGRIAYSTDNGVTWTSAKQSGYTDDFISGQIYALVYDGGKFVAGGWNGLIYTSTDGKTWTYRSTDGFVTQKGQNDTGIFAMVYNNGFFVAGGQDGGMATSTDGITWTRVADSGFSPRGDDGDIYSITYGNNMYIAVTNYGKMAYSTNGTTWTKVDVKNIFGDAQINAIAYGNNKFVAVGWGGYMGSSTNGTTWIAENSSFDRYGGEIFAITFGNGIFAAGGYERGGKITYSTGSGGVVVPVTGVTLDKSSLSLIAGNTETLTPGITPSNATNRNVTWSSSNANVATVTNGTVTAVSAGSATITVRTADGGKTATCTVNVTGSTGGWTTVANSTFGTSSINAIAYGNGKFVAVGAHGKMAYSSDGINWTAVADVMFDTVSTVDALAYGNGKFVAGNSYGKMATSTDGVTWTAVADSKFGSSSSNICAITYADNKFVAVGYLGKISYSSDGLTWTAVTTDAFTYVYNANTGTTTKAAIRAVTYANNKFVAVGSNGKMAYSSDGGLTWTAVSTSPFGTSQIFAVTYGGDKFVAGGWDGKMATSSDGINWSTAVTNSTFGTTDAIQGIAYGNNKFIAVGYGGKMASSANGTDWTTITTNAFDDADDKTINSIVYGGNKFVAGGFDGKIAYSTGN